MHEEQHFGLLEIIAIFLLISAPVFISSVAIEGVIVMRYLKFTGRAILFLLATQFLSIALGIVLWVYWPPRFDVMLEGLCMPMLLIESFVILSTYFYLRNHERQTS